MGMLPPRYGKSNATSDSSPGSANTTISQPVRLSHGFASGRWRRTYHPSAAPLASKTGSAWGAAGDETDDAWIVVGAQAKKPPLITSVLVEDGRPRGQRCRTNCDSDSEKQPGESPSRSPLRSD